MADSKYKANNPNTNPTGKKNYGKPVGKKNFKPRRNEPPREEGPERYINNSYGLDIVLTPYNFIDETDRYLFKKIGPFKEIKNEIHIPFYVVDRMRMKSAFNLIKSISDYERFKYMDFNTSEDGSKRAFFGSDEEAYQYTRTVDKAINWEDIDMDLDIDSDQWVIKFFNENGDLISWYRKKRRPKVRATNEWAAIDVSTFKGFKELIDKYIVNGCNGYAEAIDIRDETAIQYVSWIYDDCHKIKEEPKMVELAK